MKNNTTKVIVGLVVVLVVVLGIWFAVGRPPVEEPVVETPAVETPAAITPVVTPVEIRAAWWGDARRNDLYNLIIDAFQAENEGITVLREPVGWADYWSRLTVQAAGGELPDFMGMHAQFASDYLGRGVIEPLDSFIEDGVIDITNMSESAVNTGVVDGVTYMLPMGITLQCFIINETLFEEIGIGVPSFDWTWDDLKTIGLEVRTALDAAGKQNSWLIGDSSGALQMFRYWVRQRNEGRDIYDKDGNIAFTEQDAATWFAYWNDLRQNGVVPDAATGVEFAAVAMADSLFARGRVLATNIPINQYQLWLLALPAESEISAIRNPSKVGGAIGEFAEGAHFAISSTTTPERKLAAAKLMNFWLNTETATELFRLDQGVPANTKMAEFLKSILDEQQVPILDFVEKLLPQAGTILFPPIGAGEVSSLFSTIAQEVQFDQITPEVAGARLVSEGQAIIDGHR